MLEVVGLPELVAARVLQRCEPIAQRRVGVVAQPVRCLHDVGVGVVHDQPGRVVPHHPILAPTCNARGQAPNVAGCARPPWTVESCGAEWCERGRADSLGHGHDGPVTDIRIHAPEADQVWLVLDGEDRPLSRDGIGVVGHGAGGSALRHPRERTGRRSDSTARRVLVDPHATEVWFADGHRRDDRAARPVSRRRGNHRWRSRRRGRRPRQPRHTSRPLVVYEAHVRGLDQAARAGRRRNVRRRDRRAAAPGGAWA